MMLGVMDGVGVIFGFVDAVGVGDGVARASWDRGGAMGVTTGARDGDAVGVAATLGDEVGAMGVNTGSRDGDAVGVGSGTDIAVCVADGVAAGASSTISADTG